MNKNLISVLLPVFNCEKFINECVDSILCQTYSNFELLIIDDCSSDNTVKLIKEYNDERIKLTVKEKNTGYTDSLNWGIENSKGTFIARMDGDDICMPTRFEEQIKILIENPDIVVCGSWAKIIGSDKILKRELNHKDLKLCLINSNPFIHPSVMINKKLLETEKYNKKFEPAEDFEFWTRLIFNGKFANIPKPLILYRIHDFNISKTKNEVQLTNYALAKIAYLEKLFPNILTDKEILNYFRRNITTTSQINIIIMWFNNLIENSLEYKSIFIEMKKEFIIKHFNKMNKIEKIKFFIISKEKKYLLMQYCKL